MQHLREEQISAYLDRELSSEEARALELHLDECETCSAAFDKMCALTDLFQEAERLEPSPFIWSRISAEFDENRSTSRSWKEAFLFGLRRYSCTPGLAVAALGIILVVAGFAIIKEIKVNSAEQATLAEIDRAYDGLAAQNPDAYNPFSIGNKNDINANPFRSMRLSGRTDGAPVETSPASGK
jgi:predicted anti-sigma-YlaC factor YlaD